MRPLHVSVTRAWQTVGLQAPGGPSLPQRVEEVTPSASRLTGSLRDIGYDFTTAIADLVDNSIAAGADTVSLDFHFLGRTSYISIVDNGFGMTREGIAEALRFGSRKEYGADDLGRFGLGLKTASFSQCRRVTVVSRHAPRQRRITARTLDLDHVASTDRWQIFTPASSPRIERAEDELEDGPGTVVLLEVLDRVFEGVDPEGGWAERRLDKLADETSAYLGMVFHRFIEGLATSGRVTLIVNGRKVPAWNPFAEGEERTKTLPVSRFAVARDGDSHEVTVRPFILPPRSEFSTPVEFERLGGPNRWNRQQGLYIYRSDRMVQSGGWSGLRGIDEHTKLARVAVEFPTALDETFKINVAKMRVSIPNELREGLKRRVNEVCVLADARYRSSTDSRRKAPPKGTSGRTPRDLQAVGLALESAAIQLGESDTLDRLMERVRLSDPSLAEALGF